MPRRITREHADKIVTKLKADVVRVRSAHDLARVFYDGSLVVQFGLRRSSRKNTGHGHLPASLHLSHHQTLELARCPLSYEAWVQLMREKGLIEEKTDQSPS